ncbi:ABC transporter substrate-binding protein/permease [Janibacter indicus]|uniref:ABC transporter substrate-binding protein/permease n=1 Tax=Janibacter indicus TaxID=857417 RepID=A0A7L9IZ81_9MICO|nr:ABC transporter substrate-binding protein/permease [Janibacter indicus]QOK21710.1 ABC transporter substrate-binding protein/permease [Janibacter indicus]
MTTLPRRLAHLLLALAVALGPALLSAPAAQAAPTTPDAASAQVPDPLRVGTEGVYAPFSIKQGDDFTGFDVEVMKAVGERLGVEVEFVATPWDSMFAALAAGRFDVVANQVNVNPEREKLYDLSDPYVDTAGVLVVAEDNPEGIEELSDLKGKRAAENLTSSWAEVAKDHGAEIVGVDGMNEAMSSLKEGRVDAIVNDKLAVRNYIATSPDPGVKIVAETDDQAQSVFAAKKGTGYMPEINQALAEMEEDGTTQAIYDKYFSADNAAPSAWDLVKDNAWPMAWATIKVTIPLTAISFAIGLVLALVTAIGRMSTSAVPRGIARAYISIIRGTPLLVQLFLIFYALPEIGIDLPPFVAAVIALSLNVGGYAAEVIRSAIESIPKGQWEAAQTIGMGPRTALRRIILPQAARTAIPPLSNTLVSLLKDTSLTSIILVVELTQTARFAAAPTFQYMPMFALAALYYWIICTILSVLQDRAEERFSRYVAA